MESGVKAWHGGCLSFTEWVKEGKTLAKRKLETKRLAFEIDSEVAPSLLTAHAGVPLLVELFGSSGAAAVVDKWVTIKRRERGEAFRGGEQPGGRRLGAVALAPEKTGTVEHTPHVLKNELAAGALPSGKFGANAAWFRFNMLTYNLLSLLLRAA